MLAGPERKAFTNPFRESVRVLGLYIHGQILIAIIVTALYAVGFEIAGVAWWLAVAMLCGLLNLIPKIGSIIALLLVLWIAWANDAVTGQLITVGVVWVVVQALEGFILTPRILGRPLGLRPLAVFAAILIGSLAFGPIGFLVAVPALAVANVFWRYFRKRAERY